MVKLDRDDRRDLIKLLAEMPQFADRQQRQVLLIDAGLGVLVAHMNLSAPSPSSAASEIVTYLAQYGQVDEDHEALGLLLSWIVEESLVGIEQRRDLTGLIERYQMLEQGSPTGQAAEVEVNDEPQRLASSAQTERDPLPAQGSQTGPAAMNDDQRAQLLFALSGTAFTLDDLEELCFLLGIDRENLRHDTKPHLSMDLIRYCESRSMVDRLVAAVRKARSDVELGLFTESIDNRQAAAGTRSQPGVEKVGTEDAQAGRAGSAAPAAVPGRPQFNPDIYYLPDEPLLGFVEIPAGPFRMGSDPRKDKQAAENEQPQHTVDLPAFWIARYPVTVAQFRAFTDASGFMPGDKDSLSAEPDHPVVWVSWKVALDYCDWLGGLLHEHPQAARLRARLGPGLRATLPSEAEWEKAARGADGRIYPWGDVFDLRKANTYESGIGNTTPVGSYPDGASPYGVLDMSGNVWEWTRSLWEKYPYDPKDRPREDLSAHGDRVLRGGSCHYNERNARCAYRGKLDPFNIFSLFSLSLGFRVVVLPSSSVL